MGDSCYPLDSYVNTIQHFSKSLLGVILCLYIELKNYLEILKGGLERAKRRKNESIFTFKMTFKE